MGWEGSKPHVVIDRLIDCVIDGLRVKRVGEKTLEIVGLEQVMERVVERPHVGVHLLLERARQKSEAFAGFNRRPREYDPVHLLRQ